MNGVSAKDELAGFEIITDIAGCRWLGKLLTESGDEIGLKPAYEMAPRHFTVLQTPQGPGMVAMSMPNIFPIFDRSASTPMVRVRWANRVAITDFAEEDQAFFREVVRQSQVQTRAARAGIQL